MCILLFINCITNVNANADADLTDQMNAVKAAQNQINATNLANRQAEYNAQQAARQAADNAQRVETRRQENIAINQQNAERKLREKALQEQAASNRAAMERIKIAEANAAAAEKVRNDERLDDKARVQTQEDEERNYLKAESEIRLQNLKAQADAATALAAIKAKRANDIFESELKLENTKTDVIQSVADTNRIESEGEYNFNTGAGREKLYEFLIIAGLIMLIILTGFGAWKYYNYQKIKNKDLPDEVSNP